MYGCLILGRETTGRQTCQFWGDESGIISSFYMCLIGFFSKKIKPRIKFFIVEKDADWVIGVVINLFSTKSFRNIEAVGVSFVFLHHIHNDGYN